MKKYFVSLFLFLLLVACGGPKTFTIYYNDGLLNQKIIVEKGDIIEIPLEDPKKEGYTFDWWYLDEDYSQPLDLNLRPTSSIHLYAKWIPDEYQVSFFSNGGTVYSPIKIMRDEVLPQGYIPTRKDYTFVAWYLDSSFNEVFDINSPIKKNISLFALWEEYVYPLLEEEDYEVIYVITNLGQTTNSMRINYQAKNIKTYLEYTTEDDVDFNNAKKVYPEMFYFESLSSAMELPFPGRNICRLELNDLDAGIRYLYRINQGNDTYTEVYSFKTEAENDTSDFIFITDVHYYHGFDGAEVAEDVIRAALEYNPNIDFVLNTGDMVDRGGNSIDWDKYFTKSDSFKILPQMGVPGNHEHYYIGDTVNKIYSSYFNYPDNGIGVYKGTSYYFIHNDTLFIQIDTDSPYEQGRQLEWLEEVIISNPTKFVIVGTHAPVNVVESADYNRSFMAVMEKYAVDLVLAGHYHQEVFSLSYLDKTPDNPYLGVAYFRGAAGGIKGIGSAEPKDFAKAYIISVKEDSIEIQTIDGNGKLGKKYIVTNKKLSEAKETSIEEIMDSFQVTTTSKEDEIIFSWTEKAYKNVKEISVSQDYREKESYLTIVPTPGYTSCSFNNFKVGLDHSYTIRVVFNNDEVRERQFQISLSKSMNLSYEESDVDIILSFDEVGEDLKATLQNYEIYIDDTLYKSVSARDEFFTLITSILIEKPNKDSYTVLIKLIGRSGFLYRDSINIRKDS